LDATGAPQGSAADFEIAKSVATDDLGANNYLATAPDGIDSLGE